MPSSKRVIYQMDHALRLWEDYWYLLDVLNRINELESGRAVFSKKGAVVNYASLRNHLLALHASESTRPISDFSSPFDLPEGAAAHVVNYLPESLIAWTRHSRRVYGPDADLQGILRATSLEKVRWSDVTFPFPAFAIELATPIATIRGRKYNFVLITGQTSPFRVELLLFPVEDRYKPLPKETKTHLEWLLSTKRFKRAKRLNEKLMADDVGAGKFEWHGLWFDESYSNSLVLDTAKDAFGEDVEGRSEYGTNAQSVMQGWENLIRVVVGFVLYLKMSDPHNSRASEPRLPFRSGLPGPLLISPDEVFTVSCPYRLSRLERVILGIEPGEPGEYARYELACHFREGYWRRRAGYGRDPTAPKVVHARPTIVRRDRVTEEGLPEGLMKGL